MDNGHLSQSNQSLTTRAAAGTQKELNTPGGSRRAVPGGGGSPPTTINNNNIVININKNYNATQGGNMRKQLKQVREEIFDEEDTSIQKPHPAVEEEEDEEGDGEEGKSTTQGRIGKQSRMSKKSTGHNLNQAVNSSGYEMTPLRKDQIMMKKWN